jgi:hypothetical protein
MDKHIDDADAPQGKLTYGPIERAKVADDAMGYAKQFADADGMVTFRRVYLAPTVDESKIEALRDDMGGDAS